MSYKYGNVYHMSLTLENFSEKDTFKRQVENQYQDFRSAPYCIFVSCD